MKTDIGPIIWFALMVICFVLSRTCMKKEYGLKLPPLHQGERPGSNAPSRPPR